MATTKPDSTAIENVFTWNVRSVKRTAASGRSFWLARRGSCTSPATVAVNTSPRNESTLSVGTVQWKNSTLKMQHSPAQHVALCGMKKTGKDNFSRLALSTGIKLLTGQAR